MDSLLEENMNKDACTIQSIDRTKPIGLAVGEYVDKQYRNGLLQGLFLGIIVSTIYYRFLRSETQLIST